MLSIGYDQNDCYIDVCEILLHVVNGLILLLKNMLMTELIITTPLIAEAAYVVDVINKVISNFPIDC